MDEDPNAASTRCHWRRFAMRAELIGPIACRVGSHMFSQYSRSPSTGRGLWPVAASRLARRQAAIRPPPAYETCFTFLAGGVLDLFGMLGGWRVGLVSHAWRMARWIGAPNRRIGHSRPSRCWLICQGVRRIAMQDCHAQSHPDIVCRLLASDNGRVTCCSPHLGRAH